jgi:hypothetical protein
MPAESSPAKTAICQHCGAVVWQGTRHCWLCGVDPRGNRQLSEVAHDIQSSRSGPETNVPTITPAAISSRGFSLASLMLVVTLACIICGAFSVAPGLGLLLTAAAVPALARTAVILKHQSPADQSARIAHRVVAFASSLGAVILVGIAAGVAGFVCCWGGFFSGGVIGALWEKGEYRGLMTGIVSGIALGGIAAAIVGYVALWATIRLPKGKIERRDKLILAAAVVLMVLLAYALFFSGALFYW